MGGDAAHAMRTDNDPRAATSAACETADLPRQTGNRPTYSGLLPTTLYRVDATPPPGLGGAIHVGLPALGVGLSLVDHVLTDPPLRNLHAFVGVTASPIVASRIAESIRAAGVMPYIYTLRATENFFNVDLSLNWMAGATFATDIQTTRVAQAREGTAGLAQWVAPTEIIPEEIVEAGEVMFALNGEEDFRDQNSLEAVYRPGRVLPQHETRASRQLRTWKEMRCATNCDSNIGS